MEHLREEDLSFEEEIPLALKESESAGETKLEGAVHKLQEVAPLVEFVKEVVELVRQTVELGNAGKVQQLLGRPMLAVVEQMDQGTYLAA